MFQYISLPFSQMPGVYTCVALLSVLHVPSPGTQFLLSNISQFCCLLCHFFLFQFMYFPILTTEKTKRLLNVLSALIFSKLIYFNNLFLDLSNIKYHHLALLLKVFSGSIIRIFLESHSTSHKTLRGISII